jgi:hypothetical protein
MQDVFAFRNDPKQRYAENLQNVFDAELFTAFRANRVVPG